MNPRYVLPVQMLDTRFPDVVEKTLTLRDKPRRVHASTLGQKSRHLLDSIGEQQNGASLIASPGVMKPNANLKNALIEPPNSAPFGVPFVLDFFMAFVELTGIEQFDSFQDSGRHDSFAGLGWQTQELDQGIYQSADSIQRLSRMRSQRPLQNDRSAISSVADCPDQRRPWHGTFSGHQIAKTRTRCIEIAQMDIRQS